MHPAVTALLRAEPVSQTLWTSLWHQLDRQSLDRVDAAAILASLSTRLPAAPTLTALLSSLRADRAPSARPHRRPAAVQRVNVVGTGGGPATFNVSTAAALVAAAAGVPVVKTGSGAHTSKLGSVDLIRRLGIRLTSSPAETEDVLDRYGIAFAGGYVYPHQFTQLARLLFPAPLTGFSRFLNLVGPLVADVEVDIQLTGVSGTSPVGLLQEASDPVLDRHVWWCGNAVGADELLSVTDNTIRRGSRTVPVPTLGGGAGSLAELRPVEDPAEATEDFLAVLAGRRSRTATETVALNAAALVLAGRGADPWLAPDPGAEWTAAYRTAMEVVESGAAVALVRRMAAEPAPWSRPVAGLTPPGSTGRPGPADG